MQLPATSDEIIPIGIRGPDGVDLTQYPVSVALMADNGVAGEPADADYHTMQWAQGKVALHIGPKYATWNPPAGTYLGYVRIDTGQQQPVIPVGRIRVGDTRLT